MLEKLLGIQKNWQIIREETNRVGKEVETWSYTQLNQPADEQLSIGHMIDGYSLTFQVDCYEILPNGDLGICVDAIGGPPTLLGVKPSYRFFKRSDNSVYY